MKDVLEEVKALKDSHQGERCFVLGNGPSLGQHDLSLLQEEFVFATNWFVLNPHYASLKKLFYCLSDLAFMDGDSLYTELEDAFETSAPKALFLRQPIYDAFIKTHSERASVFPVQCELGKHPVAEGHFHGDLTKTLGWGWTTVIDLCLPIAYYLGFQEVYLLGCDCDYQLDTQGQVGKSGYFFNQAKLPASYQEKMRQFDHPDGFNRTGVLQKNFGHAEAYYRAQDRLLMNAGVGGALDTIPRVSFEALFEDATR